MRLRTFTLAAVAACALAAAGCRQEAANTNGGEPAGPPAKKEAAPLSEAAFKAQLTVANPPARLRAGQKETINVRVKNVSAEQWFARGGEVNSNPDNRYYIAAGNRWLRADGQTLVTNMDGRYGLQRDLRPGEEEEIPLQITAPKEPGDYVLEVDLIQEQVAWFSDKGSPTTKVNVKVVK